MYWRQAITIRKGEATLAAHVLRRTAAALALKGGADLRQIRLVMGRMDLTYPDPK
jgi:site-specific recombinase XerD